MLETIHLGRDALIQTYGCSRRLATRLGALLGKRRCVTALVLEEARAGSAVETLLLKKALLDTTTLPETLQELLAGDAFAELAEEFPLTVIEQDGWQVIAAEEETLAEAGFAASTSESASGSQLPAMTAPQSPSRPLTETGDTAAAFQPAEVARLRVNIFAGNTSADKVAALKQFLFAPVAEAEKCAVLLQALADEDPALRAAAAAGLRTFGVPGELTEILRRLSDAEGETPAILVERIGDLARNGNDLARDAILMALMGLLRDPKSEEGTLELALQTLATVTPTLGVERLAREEILHVLLERSLGAPDAVLLGVRESLSALETLQPGWAAQALLEAVAKSSSARYRAGLLEILTGMRLPADALATVMPVVVETFLSLNADSEAVPLLDALFLQYGAEGLALLAEKLPESSVAHQRHGIRLFDNALRARQFPEEARATLGRCTLTLLQTGPKQVRSDALETRILSGDAIPAEVRTAAAESFLQDLHAYSHFPLCETLENALVRLGAPAITPLLARLRECKHPADGTLLCKALGRIGEEIGNAGAESGTIADAEEIARTLQALSFSTPEYRDAIHLALGQVASSTGLSKDAGRSITRTLMQRLDASIEGANTLEALGLCCRGNGPNDAEMRTVARIAMQHLQSAQPDPEMQTAKLDGEDVFIMGDAIDIYADFLPACIRALHHVIVAPRAASALREELLDELLEVWQRAVQFDIQWGPANVTLLTESLGRIGCADDISHSNRIKIAHTLSKRAKDISVLLALAEILARGDRLPQLDRLGGSLIVRLLKILEQAEDLHIEDQEIYLRILARIGMRGRFEVRSGKADRLFDRLIDALLAGIRRNVPNAQKHLLQLRAARFLPEAHKTRIEKECKRFTSLVKSML